MNQLSLFTMNNEKITLKQRIWTAVKNEQGATAIRIAKILEEDRSIGINPALSTLEKQGYIYSYGRGTKADPKRWYTDQETYVPIKDRDDLVEDHNCKKVLPLVPAGTIIPPRPTLYKPNVQPMLGFGLPYGGHTNKIDAFMSCLTMSEAQALYDRLGTYFGPKQEAA